MDIISYALSKKGMQQSVSDYLDEHLTNPTNPPIDTSLTIAGAAADSKETGNRITDLKEGLNSKVSTVNGIAPDANGNVNVSGGGISAEIKSALLQIAEKVAYIDAHGQSYYNDLYNALYALDHITAIFTQGSTVVYSNDSLDSLKRMLVVTAYYGDGTSAEVSDYTLSGTLTEGTSTITVTYLTKTATFNVTVTSASTSARIEEYGKLYGNNGIILTDGTENGAITVKYTMDSPSSVLYPAGIIPYTNGLIEANKGALVIYNSDDSVNGYVDERSRWAQVATGNLTEYNGKSWNTNTPYYKIAFSLDARYLDNAYMYDYTTKQIWFAGINTPYYGMTYVPTE